MNTLYIYRDFGSGDNKHVATITGEDNEACEVRAEQEGYFPDSYAWTYSPGFGAVDGLTENPDAVIIDATS